MDLNNPINNARYDRATNNEFGNFLETLTHRLETVGLGNRTGLLEDVLRESPGEIPSYYKQEEVEAMALCSFILKLRLEESKHLKRLGKLCSFILKLPLEERKHLKRLGKLFDERQMAAAIWLLFGYLPEDPALRQKASETVLTFLSRNPLGLSNLWHYSRLAASCLLQRNPKITRDQILSGASQVEVLPRGIGIITPKSACEELIVYPLAGSTGIILILNYEGGAKAVVGGHFDSLDLVIADPEASDELRKSCSGERSLIRYQELYLGWDALRGNLSCEDIISVLRALRSTGCDGPPTSVRIHIASPNIASEIAAAQRICEALLKSDPLCYASNKSITQTPHEFSSFRPGLISVSKSEAIPSIRMRELLL
jgi:hypothetical protein